ncbi:MAG: peptide deformylase [Alphaproteobacteria bacterium]
MAILKIAKMGHPCLRTQAATIDQIDDDILSLVENMIETMEDAQGTGLAAPQVHVSLSLLVYFLHHKSCDDVPLTAIANPIITPLDDVINYDWEGCLSVPGLNGVVPRYSNIHLSAINIETGNYFEAEYQDYHARVLQHEIDHLQGILYPQRMDDLGLLVYSDNLKHGMPEHAKTLIKLGNHQKKQ